MAEYSLSFYDLGKVNGFDHAVVLGNKREVERILFENGLNVSEKYEYARNTHRTLEGKQYTGVRVEGVERTDPEWIASGCASMQAKIEAGTEDITLRHVLRRMSYQGISDKAIIDL